MILGWPRGYANTVAWGYRIFTNDQVILREASKQCFNNGVNQPKIGLIALGGIAGMGFCPDLAS